MNVPNAPKFPREWADAPLDPTSTRIVAPDSDDVESDERLDSPGRSSALPIARTSALGLLSILATFYGGCALALFTYTFVDPWTTGIQIQRRLGAEASYEKRYEPRPLSALDDDLPIAVVAAEDTRFFQHRGIDWKAIGEAVEENHDGDDQRRGGSSISQQLAKNLFLTTHSTYLRKALELPLTYMAELLLSKRRILELYLNVIEWGPGVYGAEAAAQYHYGQSASQLTRHQAAALAACIPNPRVRRPQIVGWYRDVILSRMDVLGRLPIAISPSQTGTDRGSSPPSPEPDSARPTSSTLQRGTPDSVSTDALHIDSTMVEPTRVDSVARHSPSPPETVSVQPAVPETLRADSIDVR